MLFEAFISDPRKTAATRHIEDAHLAIAAFQGGMRDPANFQSSVEEAICLSLLGAMMLRTGWATDPAIVSRTLPHGSSACVRGSPLVEIDHRNVLSTVGTTGTEAA
jgi:hypothetical protein